MTAVTALPYGRALTRDDLDALPDDGHRYELLDGALIVTPAPSTRHQSVAAELYTVLREAAPAELKVLFAPLDVVLADDTVLQPDLLVAPRESFTDRDLPTAPLLAVEVLSSSTRRIDLLVKHDRYGSAGCAAYWLVDPEEPSVVAWELGGDDYVEAGRASGSEVLELDRPFPVRVCPAELTR
ncbi:MAG TPA: Uma2 family endonuclease [Jiangellales bacterium]|nr:Uma2 family endonuclease [Jiangellales bacterium]